MFARLYPDSNRNQFLSFVFSLCLQVTVLLAIAMIGGSRFPQMSGVSIHAENARSAFTPIYFQPDSPAAPSIPEAAAPVEQPAPAEVSEPPSDTPQEASNAQAGTGNAHSGDGDSSGEEVAPFSTWSMNPAPNSFMVFGHLVKPALAVFTPDPPILHGDVPEGARGKDMVLDVVIDNQGSITQATVLQGVGYGVENSVMETLRRWIFVPAKVNGVAIASRRQLRFHFPG